MLEDLAQISKRRLAAWLALSYLTFLEVVSLLTSQSSLLCLVETQIEKQADGSQHEYCPAFHVAAVGIGNFLESHNGAVTALATLAIAVFTWTLWKSTEGMLGATTRAVELARREFLSTHRPTIRIKHVWLMNEFWHDHPLRIKVVCVNYGTTEARVIDYGFDFLLLRKDAPLPPDHQFAFRRTIIMMLRSGISGEFPELVQPIPEDTEIRVRSEECDFYCLGYLHYLDGICNPRTTAFCRRLVLDQPLRGGGHFVKIENPDYEYED